MRIAVTMEAESWIIRRLAERFAESAGKDCEVVMLLATDPIPAGIDAVLYADWPHYLLQPKEVRNKVPAVLMVHHLDRFAFRLRIIARREDILITCMSRRWVHFLKRWTFPADKLVQLHYGIDMQRFQPETVFSKSDKVCIGVVGRLYPDGRKGEDRLLEIAHKLSPSGYRFQFMGERWEQVVAELRQRGFSVEVAERCSEAEQPEIYRRMDCLLVCSRKEGGPLPVIEALASGVPVVSSDVGFVPELQEALPFAVKMYSQVDDAVSALGCAWTMKELMYRQQSEVQQKVAVYAWDSWAKRLVALLKQVQAAQKRG